MQPGDPMAVLAGPGPALDRTRAVASTGALGSDERSMGAWRLWWEMNKLRFLRANRLEDEVRGAVTPGAPGPGAQGLQRSRELVADTLRASLGDADAQVRGRAAVAYARLAGREALAELEPLLSDPSLFVREAAILAHGASGAPAVVPRLLALAGSGALADGSEPSPVTRELALLALGLGRRAGLRDSIDPLVASWIEEQPEDPRLAHGAMLYHALAADAELSTEALRWIEDEDGFSVLRCRATESLATANDPELIGPLAQALGSRDRQVRRSAALALGQLRHPLVVGPLQTAFEVERNPITRGFLLLAMAEHGGEHVRRMLAEVFEDGDRALRPFAALALGLQARVDDDAISRRLLRREIERGGNPDERGALLLAAGIARDASAVTALVRAAEGDADPDTRMLAALALGMTGDARAHGALRERLEHETSHVALTGVAQAVALFGDAADTPALLHTLHAVKDPALTVLVSVALAFHGTSASLQGLTDVALATDTDDATRATALEALGLMLDDQPGLQLARLTRNSNYRAFPQWLMGVVSASTL